MAAFAALLLAIPASLRAQVYAITDLDTLGSSLSYANGINAKGQVGGTVLTANGYRAFLYSNGVMTALDTLGGGSSFGSGINDAGAVVGGSETPNFGPMHAFLFQNGVMQDIHSLPSLSNFSYAYGINNTNQVAGKNANHAFVRTGATAFDFGEGATPMAINASGTICGLFTGSPVRAFISRGTSLVDLGTPAGSSAYAYAINNTNVVVGTILSPSGQYRAFLWNNGSVTDLGTLGGQGSWASGVNNRNEVVGTNAIDFGPNEVAIYWSAATGMVNLNTLLPTNSGWHVNQANAINDSGQIAGWGYHGSLLHAFLMTPIALKSFTISPGTVAGGLSAVGKITLNDITPADITVTFASANPHVPAPASVRILAGTSSRSFTLGTTPTSVATGGSVTASYNGRSVSAPITVGLPHISSLTLSASSVRAGAFVTGTVTLEAAPAAPTTVTLVSSNTALAQPTVSSLVINPGSKSATFTLTTFHTASSPVNLSIRATANGAFKDVALTVNP